tara:strand:+ start:895 stop:2124 length:1230 start_codon:yes stop_codon:yes gene_type:complete
MSTHEDDLWDMSDEDLEAAFKNASAEENSPETEIENSVVEDGTDTAEEEEFDSSEEPGEEIEDGSDQPEVLLEESDHDASNDPEATEVDEDDTAKTEEENPDGDAETDAEESSDETDETKDEMQPKREYSFRANGKDYEFSSEEIVDQFPKIFGKAMDYTKKMQAIKPWRKTIDAIEEAKISHNDVSLMIDVLKGDKEAITEVLKRTGTDTLELNTEEDSNYIAKDYGRDESALAISDIVDEIHQDVEYATTHNILSKEWDERSWETISKNPEMIKLLHTDVKSGMYKTLQPIAEKLKVYDGGNKPDLDYYKAAAQQHFTKTAEQKAFKEKAASKMQEADAAKQISEKKQAKVEQAKVQSQKRATTESAAAKRKAAATTKTTAAARVTDYLDESDESFDDWYKQVQDSM